MTELIINSNVIIETIEKLDQDILELNVRYEHTNHHGLQTMKCLDAMRKERQLCDVILTNEGHELFAHRALLSCHSNYFFEIFLRDEADPINKRQIYYQIDGIEYLPLKLIIQFIYQGSFQLTPDLVPKVYLTAYQLKFDSIVQACSNYLAEQLNPNNCLSIRFMAMDDELRNKATECIQNHFLAILQTREFHLLPSVKLELVDTTISNINIMPDLILHWIIQQIRKYNGSIQELEEYTHLVYLNGDRTLHDCADMDETNMFYSDTIKDYQSYKVTKRNLSTTTSLTSSNENLIFEQGNLQISNNNLPLNSISNLSTIETKFIHIEQSTDHTYVAIAIIQGKMLSIAIHISSSTPNTPDFGEFTGIEKFSEIYNLIPEKDMPVASLSMARCGFGIVSTEDTIYAVGGYDRGDCLDTIEQFEPNEDKWSLLSIPMNTRRGRVSATLVKNKIFVCGGSDGQEELNTGEYFDLDFMDKWTYINDLPNTIVHGAMCSDDSYVYLIGGSEGDRCKNNFYRYDLKTNTWSELAPMLCERSQAAAIYFNKKIYVFGGYTANRCLSSCEIYNFTTNEWSIGPTMREHRRGSGAIFYENKIFIIGGSNGVTCLTSIEIFDPLTNEWCSNSTNNQNELNIPRVGLGVAVCQDELYVIGGFDGRNFLKSIEIYDRINQRWKLTAKQSKIE